MPILHALLVAWTRFLCPGIGDQRQQTRTQKTCPGYKITGKKIMLFRIIIGIFFVFIFFTLGSALVSLVKEKGTSTKSVKALTWRIGLSIVMFLFLMLAYALGWVTPHSI